jgi:ribosome production factor 1
MVAALFPLDPQFRGRRVVTVHNQRDFMFVRHHRCISGLALYQLNCMFSPR